MAGAGDHGDPRWPGRGGVKGRACGRAEGGRLTAIGRGNESHRTITQVENTQSKTHE